MALFARLVLNIDEFESVYHYEMDWRSYHSCCLEFCTIYGQQFQRTKEILLGKDELSKKILLHTTIYGWREISFLSNLRWSRSIAACIK